MRETILWKEREKLGKVSKERIDKNKQKSQREKFCKCKKCGGQMDYISGTNIFVCNCKTFDAKGNEKICGNVNIVDDKYMDYVDYLFRNV